MMLAGSRLRVVLATTHLPLARVPKAITRKGLAADLALLSRELERARHFPPPDCRRRVESACR